MTNYLEILPNFNHFFGGFKLTEPTDKPFYWIVLPLAIVATILSVTQWQDIPSYIAWVVFARIGKCYPVIHSQRVSIYTTPTAYRATVVKVFKRETFVCMSKAIRQVAFSRTSALLVDAPFISIVKSPFVSTRASLVEIPSVSLGYFPVVFIVIRRIILGKFFVMFGAIYHSLCRYLFAMFRKVYGATHFTLREQPVFTVFVSHKELSCGGKLILAFRTTFEVIHSVSLSLYLKWLPTIAEMRRLSVANLVGIIQYNTTLVKGEV